MECGFLLLYCSLAGSADYEGVRNVLSVVNEKGTRVAGVER